MCSLHVLACAARHQQWRGPQPTCVKSIRVRQSETCRWLWQMHRLDAETGGLLLVGKTRPAFRALHAALEAREVSKQFTALVGGRLLGKGRVDQPLDGEACASGWRALGAVQSRRHGWVTTVILHPLTCATPVLLCQARACVSLDSPGSKISLRLYPLPCAPAAPANIMSWLVVTLTLSPHPPRASSHPFVHPISVEHHRGCAVMVMTQWL